MSLMVQSSLNDICLMTFILVNIENPYLFVKNVILSLKNIYHTFAPNKPCKIEEIKMSLIDALMW